MVNPKVDELSMMTYVSQFPDAKLKPGAPIKPKGDASKVKVIGPGIEKDGVQMGMPVQFYVDSQEAGHGKLDTFITNIDDEIEVRVEDKKDGSYTCSYVPPCDGLIQVHVLWNNKHVNDSPFNVNVSPITNALACRAYGPGVEGGNLKEDDMVNFTVETKGAGPGDLGICVKGPKGTLECDINKEDDDKFNVSYIPPAPGQYMVEVTFSDLHIKDSPFKIKVEPNKPDASKCHAEGPGIGQSLIIGEETWFTVDTSSAGKGELVTNIRSPHGEVPVNTHKEGNITTYTYSPNESGELVITVKYGGDHIPGSRFRVQVDPPPNASKCIATGPGLAQAGVKAGEPAHFKVKTKDAGKGDIGVHVTGPLGDVPVKTSSSSSHENDFVYVPVETGFYEVEINFAGEPIPGSVFHVGVTDPSKVNISGPGMDGELLPANKLLKYTVDASSAGPGVLACHVQSPVVNKEEVDNDDCNPFILKQDEEEEVYDVLYTPKDVGLHKMKVSFDDAPIPQTPIRLNVFDASKVIAKGPGLENGNKTGSLTHFTIDLKQAGEGNLHVDIAGPSEVTLALKDQANDMIYAEYTPDIPGYYAINIELQGVPIVGSPFEVNVKPRTDPSAVRAYGMGLESTDITTGMMAEFTVDFTEGGEGEVQVSIQGPGGGVEYKEETVSEGVTKYTYLTDPDESGYYNIDVCFNDQHVPNSPFQVPVKWKSDPSRVIADGTGLQGGITKEWAEFNLDLRKAGEGGVNVNIHGPDKVEVAYENHEDGTMTVKYFPNDPGDYQVDIQFNGEHIPGSVFSPVFYPCTDATKCIAFGPGLNKNGIRVGDPGDFVIDTSKGGKGAVDVIVNGPIGGVNNNRRGSTPAAKPIITNNQDGTYSVVYNPRKVGVYNISVVFGDEEIPDSPFRVNITDPDKIVLNGPGCNGEGKQESVYNSIVSQPLQWTADCSAAGPGELVAAVAYKNPITDNDDDEVTTETISTTCEDEVHLLNFTPTDPLLYQLNILYSGNPVSDTPIVSVLDPSKVKIYGPALDGVNVNETASFTIDTSEAGTGNLSLELTGPSPGTLEKENGEQVSLNNFSFVPSEAGTYQLNVKFGNEDISSCPIILPVRDISKLNISGSGVTGANARVTAPVDVVIDTNKSGPAPITVIISDPTGDVEPLDLSPSPDDDNVFIGSYIPSKPGHYEVAVKFDNEDTDMSPYRVPIGQPENVILKGKGLERAFVGHLNIIDCITEEAGPGVITAQVEGVSSNDLPTQVEVVEIDDNHYEIHYKVESPGLYAVNVLYNGFPVENEPRTVPAFDLSKCVISGDGIVEDSLANKPTQFIVDTKLAGKGSLQIVVQDPNEQQVSTDIREVEEGVYEVEYTPLEAGGHVINVLFEDKDVYQSPILVSVADPSQVVCSGPGLSHAIVNTPAEFSIDTSKAGDSSLNIEVIGPEEVEKLECHQSQENSSLYDVVYYAKKAGLYQVHVLFASQDVPGSPFKVDCQRPSPDASKCRAIDLDKPYNFTVDCSEGGGTGLLEVGVCGSYVPADLISVHHNGDYTFSVSYKISEPGETTISVKWHGQHLTGSPFTVNID